MRSGHQSSSHALPAPLGGRGALDLDFFAVCRPVGVRALNLHLVQLVQVLGIDLRKEGRRALSATAEVRASSCQTDLLDVRFVLLEDKVDPRGLLEFLRMVGSAKGNRPSGQRRAKGESRGPLPRTTPDRPRPMMAMRLMTIPFSA